MAKSRENGSTILLRLKGYEVEKVMEEEEGIIAEVRAIGSKRLNCPRCGTARLHRHGSAMKRKILHSWSSGDARNVVALLLVERSCCSPTQG
jgi:transposase